MEAQMNVISPCTQGAEESRGAAPRIKSRQGLVITICMLGSLALTSAAHANPVFFDNFEDGNTSGWLESASGAGSISVELHNGSQMARVQQIGNGGYALSMDFGYLASETLSFDMQAVSNTATSTGTTVHSIGGFRISFLNAFNVGLGSAGLVRATNTNLLSPNDNLIDGVQHNYTALVSDYAALAGLGAEDPISKMSLTFFATGQTGFFGQRSNATVWFDNVAVGNVGAVPVPAAAWLFGSGLVGLTGIARRKKT